MPHLVQMDSDFRNKGLTLVAAEVQGSDNKAIKDILEAKGAEFPVLTGTTRPSDMKSIPHMVVFNAAGEQIYSGHPSSGGEAAIKKALADVAPDKMAAPGPEASGGGFGLAPREVAVDLIAERAWTNSKGQTMTAALVSLEGDTATFRMAGGNSVPYDIKNLSDADQTAIREAAAPKPEAAAEE